MATTQKKVRFAAAIALQLFSPLTRPKMRLLAIARLVAHCGGYSRSRRGSYHLSFRVYVLSLLCS